MKKLFLLIGLIVGCSNVNGVKVSKEKDASTDVSVAESAIHVPQLTSTNALQYCNAWCSHLAKTVDANAQCSYECSLQYSDQ